MPLIHLAAVVSQLAPGAMVRLNVGNTSPYNWCLPGVYQIQTDWLRPDLYWQFTGSNATRLAEWQRVISEIRGVN